MKVVTYNIHRGRSTRGRDVLPEIAAALAGRAADIVACQEVLGVVTDGCPNQAAWLGRALDMHAHFVANDQTLHGPLGNAILSRTPLPRCDHVDLSVRGFERRAALGVVPASGARIWNVHLGLTRRQRAEQWRRMAERLRGDAGHAPAIVCGDFNDWDGALRRAFDAAGLRSSLAEQPRRRRWTFPARRPWLALDRIYYRGVRLVDAEVLRGPPWPSLSDHLPVEARFVPGGRLPEERPS